MENIIKKDEPKVNDNQMLIVTGKQVKDFKVLAGILVVALLIISIWGMVGVVFETRKSFLFHLVIQNVLMYQYIAFTVLYDIDFPQSLSSFLGSFYKFLIQYQNIFGASMQKRYGGDSEFSYHYKVYTSDQFRDQEIYVHFLTNFGLILVIHCFILFLTLLSITAYYIYHKRRAFNRLESDRDVRTRIIDGVLSKIKHVFSVRIIMSSFLVLIVETTIFAFYNFTHTRINHPLLIFSIYLAFSYLVVTLYFLLKSFFPPKNRHGTDEFDKVHYDYQYLVKGVRLPRGKTFHALQYLFYFIFAVVILVLHQNPRYAVIINLLLMCGWVAYYVLVKPVENEFLNVSQIFTHALLVLMLIFFAVIVFNQNMQQNSKEILGEIVVILMVMVLFYNLILIFYYSIIVWAEYGHSDENKHKYVKCSNTQKSEDPFSDHSEENRDEEKRGMMKGVNNGAIYESDLKEKVAYF